MSSLFGRSPGAGGLTQDQNARKVEVMNQVRQELASAHLQELVNNMTQKCYSVCVPSGSSGLSKKDETCLSNCQDRFLESFDVVSRAYVARIGKERQAAVLQSPGGLTGSLDTQL